MTAAEALTSGDYDGLNAILAAHDLLPCKGLNGWEEAGEVVNGLARHGVLASLHRLPQSWRCELWTHRQGEAFLKLPFEAYSKRGPVAVKRAAAAWCLS